MITTPAFSRGKRGFTLAEVMIATTLLGFLLAGLVGTFVFMLRSSVSLGNYADMNRDASYFLERFGREVRMVSDVKSISNIGFMVEVDSASGDDTVQYIYDSTNRELVRLSILENSRTVVLDNISTLNVDYYNILGAKTNNLNEVKSLQLRVDLQRDNIKNDNTDHIISARFNMRNRIITN